MPCTCRPPAETTQLSGTLTTIADQLNRESFRILAGNVEVDAKV